MHGESSLILPSLYSLLSALQNHKPKQIGAVLAHSRRLSLPYLQKCMAFL